MQKYRKNSSTEDLSKREFTFYNFSNFFALQQYAQFFQENLLFSNILVKLRFGYLRTCNY